MPSKTRQQRETRLSADEVEAPEETHQKANQGATRSGKRQRAGQSDVQSEKRPRRDYSTFIVVAGEEKEEYHVIKAKAMESSKFFVEATSTERIELPAEVGTILFERYLDWLYYGEISVDEEFDPKGKGKNGKRILAGKKLSRLLNIYKVGLALDDVSLRNAVIDAILEMCVKHEIVPGWECIEEIWDDLPARSPLRRLLVRYWTKFIEPPDIDIKGFAGRVIRDFAVHRDRIATLATPSMENSSEWHEPSFRKNSRDSAAREASTSAVTVASDGAEGSDAADASAGSETAVVVKIED